MKSKLVIRILIFSELIFVLLHFLKIKILLNAIRAGISAAARLIRALMLTLWCKRLEPQREPQSCQCQSERAGDRCAGSIRVCLLESQIGSNIRASLNAPPERCPPISIPISQIRSKRSSSRSPFEALRLLKFGLNFKSYQILRNGQLSASRTASNPFNGFRLHSFDINRFFQSTASVEQTDSIKVRPLN